MTYWALIKWGVPAWSSPQASDLLDSLLAKGWEPYAVEYGTIHLRKQVVDISTARQYEAYDKELP